MFFSPPTCTPLVQEKYSFYYISIGKAALYVNAITTNDSHLKYCLFIEVADLWTTGRTPREKLPTI
jgi:hypothetical protein